MVENDHLIFAQTDMFYQLSNYTRTVIRSLPWLFEVLLDIKRFLGINKFSPLSENLEDIKYSSSWNECRNDICT